MNTKKYVLITGATSGIGYELAKLFNKHGYALILVGRSQDKLNQTKQILNKQIPNNRISLICQDLSEIGAARSVYERVKAQQLKVEILINNAGAGYVGDFTDEKEEKILEHIQLNMTTLTLLTRYFAEDMKRDRKGRIVNIASTGAYHPGVYTAVYYATKAYVLSLSEALYEELKPFGVGILSVCPGATKTNFAKSAGRVDSGIAMNPEIVAGSIYKGIMKNKRVIIPGIKNKLWICIPKKVAIPFIKRYQKRLIDEGL